MEGTTLISVFVRSGTSHGDLPDARTARNDLARAYSAESDSRRDASDSGTPGAGAGSVRVVPGVSQSERLAVARFWGSMESRRTTIHA